MPPSHRSTAANRILDHVFGYGATTPAAAHPALTFTTVERDLAQLHELAVKSLHFQSGSAAPGLPNQFTIKIVLVLEGTLQFDQWRLGRRLQAGDAMVICNWIPFQLTADQALRLRIVSVPAWWGLKELAPDAAKETDLFIPSTLFSAPLVAALTEQLLTLAAPAAAQAAALRMLLCLIRESLPLVPGDPQAISSLPGRIGRILVYIYQHIAEEGITPATAADALKCSVRTVHKSCAEHGTSFNQVLMEIRLTVAAYNLATQKIRVSDAAYTTGFVSLSHFCRVFKTRFGIPASAYRRNYQSP